MVDALEEFGQTFDERLTGIDDPAELVAAGFRLSARMADSHPELMQVLRRRGLGHLHSDNGLARRALRDLQAGLASGRFTAVEPVVALSALGGTLLSLVELRFARPDGEGARPRRTSPRWSCACWPSPRTTPTRSPGAPCPTWTDGPARREGRASRDRAAGRARQPPPARAG